MLPAPLDLGQELHAELAAIGELPIGTLRLLAAFGMSGGYAGRRFEELSTSDAARGDLRQHARAPGEDAAALADSLLGDAAKFPRRFPRHPGGIRRCRVQRRVGPGLFDQLHHGIISLDRRRLLVMPSAFGAPIS